MNHATGTLLRLRDLRFACILGVHPWEQETRQVIVHIEIGLRPEFAARAAARDALTDTVDYSQLELRIARLLESRSFQLLEAMADTIAQEVLEEPAAQSVRVEIEKPGALRFAPSVAIVHVAANS